MTWYFLDKNEELQGPFQEEDMRAWYEAGYLAADLMISQTARHSEDFSPLADVFPNGMIAFLSEDAAAEVLAQSAEADAETSSSGGEWYFKDTQGNVQGPFSDTHMRQWHMAGYFQPDLEILNSNSVYPEWSTLQDAFPDMSSAFLVAHASVSFQSSPLDGNIASAASTEQRFFWPNLLPHPPPFRGVKKVYPSEKRSGVRRPNKVAITDLDGNAVSAAWDSDRTPKAGDSSSNKKKKRSMRVDGATEVQKCLKTMDGLLQLLECEINAVVPQESRKRLTQVIDRIRKEQDMLLSATSGN